MSMAVTIQGLTKSFGRNVAVDGVKLTVREGEVYGFLGPNGAGKTTTIRCIMDFIRPDHGIIEVFGNDAHRDSVAVKRMVGYVPSDNHLVARWTGREHIDYVRRLKGVEAAPTELVGQFSLDLDKKVRALSTGNRQKLSIILGLMGQPKLIIMDEPTQGLDPLFQNAVYKVLREFRRQGGTIFVSSHNLPEVQRICDRVGIIREGKLIAEESLESLREKSSHLVSVRFSKPVPKSAFERVGLSLTHHDGQSVEFTVQGSLDPAVRLLAKYDVLDLEVTHASLEDVFMRMYA